MTTETYPAVAPSATSFCTDWVNAGVLATNAV